MGKLKHKPYKWWLDNLGEDDGFKTNDSRYLFNEETKARVIKELNDNINIPILNEKTEAKIFEAIWDSVEAILKKVILK